MYIEGSHNSGDNLFQMQYEGAYKLDVSKGKNHQGNPQFGDSDDSFRNCRNEGWWLKRKNGVYQ